MNIAIRCITTDVMRLKRLKTTTIIAHFCCRFKDMGIQVTVNLNNNLTWDAALGVLYFVVVDGPEKVVWSLLAIWNPPVNPWEDHGGFHLTSLHVLLSDGVAHAVGLSSMKICHFSPFHNNFDENLQYICLSHVPSILQVLVSLKPPTSPLPSPPAPLSWG